MSRLRPDACRNWRLARHGCDRTVSCDDGTAVTPFHQVLCGGCAATSAFDVGIHAVRLLGEKPLSIFEFSKLVVSSDPVDLSQEAYARIDTARALVAKFTAGDEPVYGLNTGLGGNLGFRIGVDAISDFQVQLIRGRNIGVGEPFSPEICRAALLSRINTIAGGGSGISRAAIAVLVGMFNREVTPVIPARGSISAADLGLSAHMASVVVGRGEAWFQGERMPGAAALERAGLAPAIVEPKDGLALCNHSAPSSGHAAMTLSSLADTLMIASAVAALSFEAYGGNPHILDSRLNAARPASLQVEAGALFRALVAGSSIHRSPRNIQDAVSFRCIAPLFGTVFGAFANARQQAEIELNGSPDTPLMLIADGLMLSSPNFHTSALALAMDTLCIAIPHLASASAHRIIKLMNPVLSGLPKYLSPAGGPSAGFVPMQKTTSALHAEIRLSATPASLDAIPVSDAVEDIAPLTLLAIKKLAAQLVPFKLLVAVEATVAAQAADLREGLELSGSGRTLFDVIRSRVPMLDTDRETGPDVMAVADLLDDSQLLMGLRSRVAGLSLPFLA